MSIGDYPVIDRYSRQVIFPGIGPEGQKKLGSKCAVIIGCGALGTVIATTLVRAGVGRVRIIDRDFIEYHNLQRQILFDEDDIKNQLPKAVAAEQHLKKINSSIDIEGIVADVNYTNIERFIVGADVIMDGLDNLETRFLINDVSMKHKVPWVYGAAVSSLGMTATIVPGLTPCLRCFSDRPPSGGMVLTCDTGGVVGPAPFIIGALQSAEALKILVGADTNRDLILIDVWKGRFDKFKVNRRTDCPACQGKFEFLEAKHGIKATSLCGQNAVQVLNPNAGKLSLERLAARLKPLGEVTYNEFILRFKVGGREMIIFADGRAIVKDTADESMARGLYDKYVGT